MASSPLHTLPLAGRRGSLVALAAFTLALTPSLPAETIDRIEKTLPAKPGGTLVVDLAGAKIDVRSAAGDAVAIDIERKIRASTKDAEERYLEEHAITIEKAGNVITIRQTKPGKQGWFTGFWSGLKTKSSAECSVIVPREFNVDLDTSGGPISVRDLTGSVRADTSGGSIRCENITGRVAADTSGGSITFVRVHGEANADTSGGNITAESGSGRLTLDTSGGNIRVSGHRGDVAADTSGGSITLEGIQGNVMGDTSGGSIHATLLAAPTAECRLSTSGGGITVTMPAGAAVELNAASSGGRVMSEFDVAGTEVLKKKRNEVHGPINGGGPLLHLRTSGGSIQLERSKG